MTEMDHATRRAISELASQLRMPLRDELKISFSELVGQVEIFRRTLEEISTSMRVTQDNLSVAAEELFPKMETAKRELEIGVRNFCDSAESLRGGFFENLDIRLAAVMNNSEKASDSLRGELAIISNDLRTVEKVLENSSVNLAETSQKLDNTTAGLRNEIDDWNGLLRAANHAHSKELEALSVEVSELLKNIKTRLLEEIDEQINARDNRIRQDIAENNEILMKLLQRMTRTERLIWIAVFIVALLIILTGM